MDELLALFSNDDKTIFISLFVTKVKVIKMAIESEFEVKIRTGLYKLLEVERNMAIV